LTLPALGLFTAIITHPNAVAPWRHKLAQTWKHKQSTQRVPRAVRRAVRRDPGAPPHTGTGHKRKGCSPPKPESDGAKLEGPVPVFAGAPASAGSDDAAGSPGGDGGGACATAAAAAAKRRARAAARAVRRRRQLGLAARTAMVAARSKSASACRQDTA
jgi:hypothetical protein